MQDISQDRAYAQRPVGRVVAVVVTHNRLAHLKTCLDALLRAPLAHLAGVVVVDNASEDGTVDWLSSQSDPRLRVLRLAQNNGGAGGFAAGITEAQEHLAPDWLLLLDDDAWPDDSTLSVFHHANPPPDRAICAAVFCPDGSISALNRPFWDPFRDPRKLLAALPIGKSAYYVKDSDLTGETQRPVDFATFVGFFLPESVVRRVGLPDHRYFLYCDDLEYCLRLRHVGIALILDPTLKFWHDCQTFPKAGRIFDPLWKSYYAHRNGLVLVKKVAGVLKGPVAGGLCLLWFLRCFSYRQPGRYLSLLWRAIRDGLNDNLSRPHDDILRRAERGTGWQSNVNANPKVPSISPDKITKSGT